MKEFDSLKQTIPSTTAIGTTCIVGHIIGCHNEGEVGYLAYNISKTNPEVQTRTTVIEQVTNITQPELELVIQNKGQRVESQEHFFFQQRRF